MFASNSSYKWRHVLQCAASAFLAASCTTLRVPLNAPSYDPHELQIAVRLGVEIRVRPVVDKDEYLFLFDDYLPQLGLVALWVEVHNRRDAAIEVAPGRWRLAVAGRDYPELAVPEVFDQYYRRRGVRMYSLKTDSTARRDMERMVLRSGTVPPSQERQGWLFFRLDPATAAEWPRTAMLIAKDIRLDSKLEATIEIPLSHADP